MREDVSPEHDWVRSRCVSCGHTWAAKRVRPVGNRADVAVAQPLLVTSLDQIEVLLGGVGTTLPTWLEALSYCRSRGRADLVDEIARRVALDVGGNLRIERWQRAAVVDAVVGSRLADARYEDLASAVAETRQHMEAMPDVARSLGDEWAQRVALLEEVEALLTRDDVPSLVRVAGNLRKLEAPRLALECARRALVREPGNAYALTPMAAALVDLDRAPEAIELLVPQLHEPTDVFHRRVLSRAHRKSGDARESLSLARDLLAETGSVGDAYLLLAAGHKFDDESARQEAEAVLQAATVERGWSTSRLGRLEQARRLMHERELDTAESMLTSLLKEGEWFEAENMLDQVRARQVVRERRGESAGMTRESTR